jgi:hypothetical protein
MIGSLIFPTKAEKRVRDPNKPSKFRMKVAFTLTSISLSLMSIAWVKISVDKATEKEHQMYFMLLVFLLTMLYNLNKSIVWTVWDAELMNLEPKTAIDDKAVPAAEDMTKREGGSKKRPPKM